MLSRMHKKEASIKYEIMIILSGPEPQRTLLEERLKQNYSKNVVFIKGLVEKEKKKEQVKNITYYNFMNSRQLEHTFNESELVLCRSGYTTIMDLAKLEKRHSYPYTRTIRTTIFSKKIRGRRNSTFHFKRNLK
jgi:UDP-N-acetylglucosamine transferase subunit ALG13